jgi:SCO1/SenC family protein
LPRRPRRLGLCRHARPRGSRFARARRFFYNDWPGWPRGDECRCPDFCPTALFDISAVFKELRPDKKIAALFVTVDPERDTPDILKTYRSRRRIYRELKKRWQGRARRF